MLPVRIIFMFRALMGMHIQPHKPQLKSQILLLVWPHDQERLTGKIVHLQIGREFWLAEIMWPSFILKGTC